MLLGLEWRAGGFETECNVASNLFVAFNDE